MRRAIFLFGMYRKTILLVSIMLLLTSCGTVNEQSANTSNDDTSTTSTSVTVSESDTPRDANKIIEEMVVYYGR